MMSAQPTRFLTELRTRLVSLSQHNHVDLSIPNAKSWITARPYYCDRGRFLWQIQSTDTRKLSIDGADGFPRYYFTIDALILEIGAWLAARKLEANIAGTLQGIASGSV